LCFVDRRFPSLYVEGVFTRTGLRALHSWTHERLDLLLSHALTLSQEQFVAELPGFGAASIQDQLAHVVQCEQAWVHALQDRQWTHWAREDYTTVNQLRTAKQRVVSETIAYLDQLSDTELNAELTLRPHDWSGPLRTPAFILHHVITHAFHHKGQIVAMFRLLGHPAPDTDLQRC
jgi:uncharacterized damage-inducible protein DinB